MFGGIFLKKIVVPGELVSAEMKKPGENVFVHNGKIYSQVLGLIDDSKPFASVVPLEGKYKPKPMDLVVGIIVEEKATGYMVDINSFWPSFLSKKECRELLKPGTVVSAKIEAVSEVNEVDLSDIRVFYGGEVVSISPVKVPRLIGKNGSMLDVLKTGTNSSLLVGRNGWIWLKGGNTQLAISAIQKIEREAHLENLTNRISEFIREERKNMQKVN